MTKRVQRLLITLMMGALLVVGLSGCAIQQNTLTEEQSANRNYMTQVNQIMDELSDKLQDFDDAVSRNDLVSMRTQAEDALSTLDALSSIEAPEALTDINTDYQQGADALRQALNDYVALYTEIDSATSGQPFDYSTLDSRLEQIQTLYNQGIDSLQAGDTKATEME